MDIISLFKKQPVLFRCTECYEEDYLSAREVRLLLTKNADDNVCPYKEECHICHIGFIIPVKFTDNTGKLYLYHEIKPKIKNLDPDTVMERILNSPDTEEIVFYIPPGQSF